MSDARWMIYGANGYTGRLAAEQAVREGRRPVLAGRREAEVRPLAEKLGLPWKVFELSDPEEIAEALEGVKLVLHCAGPFSRTSAPMVAGCLKAGVHYLDITGEIEVFEAVHAQNEKAKAAGVALMPGVGFDVVPSDCLAASLAKALPDAVEIELAFEGFTKASPGTTKTAVENLPEGGRVRKDGKIVKVPPAYKSKDIPFASGRRSAVSIPWGDVSTAYHSTGIPNVVVYAALPGALITGMKFSRPFLGLMGLAPVQGLLKRQIERRVNGPTEKERQTLKVELWGKVSNAAGRSVEGTLTVPEGYRFTVTAALACVERVLAGEVPGGTWTPSRAFGADFVTRLPETTLRIGP